MLATSARGAMAFGFSNGQSKLPMIDLDAVVGSVLCGDHNPQLNVYVSVLMLVL